MNTSSSSCSDDDMNSQKGLVSLIISLPGDRQVEMDVDSETPMMDLLVQIACKYGLSPSGVALRVPSERSSGYIRYQPSTPVARLNSRRIEIVDRAELSDRPSRPAHHRPPGLPFEPTQRIQIDLGRYQKTFVRISTAVTLAELLDEVCKQQVLSRRRYRIRAAAAPHITLDEQLAIREVGTTVFALVPIDSCSKRAQSTNDILREIAEMPAEEKQKKKKGFFGTLFGKSSKKSKSKSPTREGNGVANGTVAAEVSRSRPLPEVTITDDRPRGESDLSQSGMRKKRIAPKGPEPATTVRVVGSDRQSRRNSDSSSGYHESASPIEDCSSSLEKRPVDVHSVGKKKSRAPSPPPAATTHQDGPDPSAVRHHSSHPVESAAVVTDNTGKDGKDELLSDENDIATAFDEAITAGQQTMSTGTTNAMYTVEIDLNDIMPLPTVSPLMRTPTPDPQTAGPPLIVAPPPPAEREPQSVLSAPMAEVPSESPDHTVSSLAVSVSVRVESTPVIAVSSPPPPPPPPPLLLPSKIDNPESNTSTLSRPVTLQTSPTLPKQYQQLSVETPSPTDLSSQIAREAADSVRKLSPVGQRRGSPMAQRHSNIALNERQKDPLPAMRIASFEEEYAVKQFEHRTNASLISESDPIISLSPKSSSITAEDASDERLQKEYDTLRSMFDEWQMLSGRLEMRGGAGDPTTNSRMRDLQRELVQQHQIVQRLCAVVQTDAARATKNSRVDSGTERSGSSQSFVETVNSSSPSPPYARAFETPKTVSQTGQLEDKFFVKETTNVRSASKKPTGGSNAYRPKMHDDNGPSSPTNTPLRHNKTTSAPQKRPTSVHGTAFANKNASSVNGHDIGQAFRQTKHPSTEDLVITTGVVTPSMLFGERKQNASAVRTSQPVRPSESTVPNARHTTSVANITKNSVATNNQLPSPSPKTDKTDQIVELEKVAEAVLRSTDPIPNGSGGFAWPELRKVAPPVEKNGIELGAVVTSPKTDSISRNYTIADKSKRQPLPLQAVHSAKSSTANGSATKANTGSAHSPSFTESSSKASVTNGDNSAKSWPVNGSAIKANTASAHSPPFTVPSPKTPVINGDNSAKSSTVNGSATKANTGSVHSPPFTVSSSKTPVTNGDNSAKSWPVNGSAIKANTASAHSPPSTEPSSKTSVANGDNSARSWSVNKSAVKTNSGSGQSPPSAELSSKTPMANGESSAAISIPAPPPPPPPPPPALDAAQLVKQMALVTLKPPSDRKLKQPAVISAPPTEARDDLLQAIRNAGGVGSLKKVKPVA